MNMCAFRFPGEQACEERLIDVGWKSVKARICHIRARSPKGPRYDADMTDKERFDFDNLILLCPNHHVRIDDLEPEVFTVEMLTKMKWDAINAASAGNTWERDNVGLIDRAVDRLIAVMERENALGSLDPVSMKEPVTVLGAADVKLGFSASAGGAVVAHEVSRAPQDVVFVDEHVSRGAQDQSMNDDRAT